MSSFWVIGTELAERMIRHDGIDESEKFINKQLNDDSVDKDFLSGFISYVDLYRRFQEAKHEKK